jgi:c(7)-type cytochrome triheme protein
MLHHQFVALCWPGVILFRLLRRLVETAYSICPGLAHSLVPRNLLRVVCLLSIVLLQPFMDRSVAGQKNPIRKPGQQSSPRPSVDYSQFSHATSKHQQACNTCHKIPTKNWEKVRDFPDVADYPGHEACVSCHRQQFFKGASPLICTVCHTRISPRYDQRHSFRNVKVLRQFTIEFPHDKHQDVIASLQPSFEPEQRVSFVRTFFTAHSADDKLPTYNNCTICHAGRAKAAIAPATGWIDGFIPDALTFKSVPASHASCFNCHWKSQQPVSNNCVGCHKLVAAYASVGWPKRIAARFKHEGGGEHKNHVAECTTCHINITKSASLRGLKPDVAISACSECHNKPPTHVEIDNELEQLDKNREFICVYCHTSNVGKLDPPASHYLIAGREPLKHRAQREISPTTDDRKTLKSTAPETRKRLATLSPFQGPVKPTQLSRGRALRAHPWLPSPTRYRGLDSPLPLTVESNPTLPFITVQGPEQDYTKFIHKSQRHASLACTACHERSGDNSISPRFPGHKFCTSCHLAQFVTPAIPLCLVCHTNVKSGNPPLKSYPTEFKDSFNVNFDHAQHMSGAARSQNGCLACHRTPLARGVALAIPAGLSAHTQCYACHTPTAKSAAGREIASCGVCHAQKAYTRTAATSRSFRLAFSHAKHGTAQQLACADCHTLTAGLPQSRQVSSPSAAEHFPAARGISCQTCHNGRRSFGGDLAFRDCKRCHIGPSFRMPM